MAEESEKEKDERTLAVLKKYFSFFKIKGYLPKKWKKHIIRHMDDFFKFRDELKEEMQAKDDTLDALSIDEIINIIDSMADAWKTTADTLNDLMTNQENQRAALQSSFESLYNMLEEVLKEQDNADWYNPVDFAVYCGADHSLTFYYGKAPSVGDTYSGKTVTALYTGFSDKIYTGKSEVPWNEYRSLIESVVFNSSYAMVMPENCSYWFTDMANCEYLDLSYLDSRNVTAASDFATGNSGLVYIKIGGNTDLFARFDNLVSQEYWYTENAVVDGTYLHTSLAAGTYYTETPYYTGSITAVVPENFTGDVIVYLLGTAYKAPCDYSLPMYDGNTLINYDDSMTVEIPAGYTWTFTGTIAMGYEITVSEEFIEVPVTVTFSDDVEQTPDSVTVTLTSAAGTEYPLTLTGEDDWTGTITVPENGEYTCSAEDIEGYEYEISGDIHDGFTIEFILKSSIEYIAFDFSDILFYYSKIQIANLNLMYSIYVGLLVQNDVGDYFVFYNPDFGSLYDFYLGSGGSSTEGPFTATITEEASFGISVFYFDNTIYHLPEELAPLVLVPVKQDGSQGTELIYPTASAELTYFEIKAEKPKVSYNGYLCSYSVKVESSSNRYVRFEEIMNYDEESWFRYIFEQHLE